MINAHTASIVPTDNPMSVTLPDGSKAQSTHKCTMDLPDLPIATRNEHIIPGLDSVPTCWLFVMLFFESS